MKRELTDVLYTSQPINVVCFKYRPVHCAGKPEVAVMAQISVSKVRI
jgi:hypothetical protein